MTVLTDKQGVARRIAEARKRVGLSQAKIGHLLGLSRGACAQWERAISEPTMANLRELARVLGVGVDWITTGRGPQEVAPLNSSIILGGAMREGDHINLEMLDTEVAESLRAAVARREKAEVWRLAPTNNNLSGGGYHPGDYVMIDLLLQPKARDMVMAQVAGIGPIFRAWYPPWLYMLPMGPSPAPIVCDNITVTIRGGIYARFSE